MSAETMLYFLSTNLTISNLTVVHRVGLADPEESFLPVAARLLEVLVGGEGAVDVAEDDLLVRRLLGHEDAVIFDGVLH